MLPELFGCVPAYPAFLVLGVGSGLLVTAVGLRRSKAGMDGRVLVILLLGAAAGLAGAKIESVLERGGALYDLRTEVGHGYRYPGGILAAAVAVSAAWRLTGGGAALQAVADVLMPSAAAAMVVVRLGCFLAGCCHGSVTRQPWGVSFPAGSEAWERHVSLALLTADAPRSLAVHPLQLYFALGSLALAALGVWLIPRRAYAGQVALLCLLCDGLLKLGLEGLRDPPVPHLPWLSLAIAAVAGCTLLAAAIHGRAQRSAVRLTDPVHGGIG